MAGILESARRRRLAAVYVSVNKGFFAWQGVKPPLVSCDAAR